MVGDKPRNGDGRKREAQLIRQALAGNLDAGKRLVDLVLPVIHHRVRRTLQRYGMTEHAEDIAQTVWAVLLKNAARQLLAFDPTRGLSLRSYVGLIANREAGNEAKKLLTQGIGQQTESKYVDQLPAQGSRPDVAVEAADLLASLRDHLEEVLPEKGVQVFHLVFLRGLSTKEAAAALGVAEQVIYNWKHRIRTAAREFLATLDRESSEKDDERE